MRKVILDILVISMMLAVAVLALASPSKAQYVITEIIDSTGDGDGNTLTMPYAVAVDSAGNVYVTGYSSDNVFKITSGETITEIIDSTGDGSNALDLASGVAVDSAGNVYVTGHISDNAFKIATPGTCNTSGTPSYCTITEIIDYEADDGLGGNTLDGPWGAIVDSSGNVYVFADYSNNAFKIATPGTCSTGGTPCTITEIINYEADDGPGGNTLDRAHAAAVDSSDNVYVTGHGSHNVFKIETPGTCSTGGTPCTITEIIDETGDRGEHGLSGPVEVALDSSGNVYVGGTDSDNAFKIATPGTCSTGGTPCTITEIIDSTGDRGVYGLTGPRGVAADSSGNVYVAGRYSQHVFRIATPGTCSTSGTPCTINSIVGPNGDGDNALGQPVGVAVDSNDDVYVVGYSSNNAFKLQLPPRLPVLSNQGLLVLGASLVGIVFWVARRRRMVDA